MLGFLGSIWVTGASHWDWHDGGYFEVETEIELPLTRGLFYS